MTQRKIGSRTAAVALAATMAAAAGTVVAHGTGGGQNGQHMMGQGMGSGMMGQGMMGQGMMGQGMMGQGMMGQGMMGPGMMGPRMMGPGMMGRGMGPYMAGVLGLSEEQQERLDTIRRENAREHFQLMQKMHGHGQTMMKLYDKESPDPEAVGAAWSKMAEVRRRMLEQAVRMNNRMREVLTEEQRERLDEMRRFGYPDE